jgi:hypothetical protein
VALVGDVIAWPLGATQSACVRAPVLRVTRFGPQLTCCPRVLGFSEASPPGQKLLRVQRVQELAAALDSKSPLGHTVSNSSPRTEYKLLVLRFQAGGRLNSDVELLLLYCRAHQLPVFKKLLIRTVAAAYAGAEALIKQITYHTARCCPVRMHPPRADSSPDI